MNKRKNIVYIMSGREGFCFYIFHQPKLPEAFREKE